MGKASFATTVHLFLVCFDFYEGDVQQITHMISIPSINFVCIVNCNGAHPAGMPALVYQSFHRCFIVCRHSPFVFLEITVMLYGFDHNRTHRPINTTVTKTSDHEEDKMIMKHNKNKYDSYSIQRCNIFILTNSS